ncbi:hypothetical protein JCM5353_002110, partial [Sporobolomyces roseus]
LNVHWGKLCGQTRLHLPNKSTSPQPRSPSPDNNYDNSWDYGGGYEEGQDQQEQGGRTTPPPFPAVRYGPERPSMPFVPPDPPRNPYTPYADFDQYSFAEIAQRYGLSDACVQELLWREELRGQATFKSKEEYREVLESMPNDIPFSTFSIGPLWPESWTQAKIDKLPAALKRPQQFYARNLVEVAKLLASSIDFAQDAQYRSRMVVNKFGHQVLEETCDGKRWRDLEGQLPPNESLLYGIFASDKVSLTSAMGRKSGYPGYFSLGNLSSSDRLEIRRESTIKVAAFPVFDSISKVTGKKFKKAVRLYRNSIMRGCFEVLFKPLLDQPSFEVCCGDRQKRICRLVIAAVLADYPEQCLLAAILQHRCPVCNTPAGHLAKVYSYRDPETSYYARFTSRSAKTAIVKGYRMGNSAAFDNLPLHNISRSFTPDLLHQILKPLKDYILDWIKLELEALDKEDGGSRVGEFDLRLQLQQHFTGLKHFSNGSDVKGPWGGDDSRALAKILLGCVTGLGLSPPTFQAIRSYVDLLLLARLPRHSDSFPSQSSVAPPLSPLEPTLVQLDHLIRDWKEAIEQGAFAIARPEGFDQLVRMHSLLHLPFGIRNFGPPLSLSTDGPERRHQIDEKKPFTLTSKHHATEQVIKRNGLSFAMHQLKVGLKRKGEPDLKERVRKLRKAEKRRTGRDVAAPPTAVSYSMNFSSAKAPTAHPHRLQPQYAIPTLSLLLLAFLQNPQNSEIALSVFHSTQIGIDDVNNLLICPATSLTIHYQLTDISFSPLASPAFESTILRSTPVWMFNDDTTRTRSSQPNPRYDCALVRVEGRRSVDRVTIRVARVRLLFALLSPSGKPICKLAYVEWLVKGEDSGSDKTEMPVYRRQKTSDGVQVSSLINAGNILRPAHLQPCFDYPTPLALKRREVFEQVDTYFLNTHIDHDFWSYFQ